MAHMTASRVTHLNLWRNFINYDSVTNERSTYHWGTIATTVATTTITTRRWVVNSAVYLSPVTLFMLFFAWLGISSYNFVHAKRLPWQQWIYCQKYDYRNWDNHSPLAHPQRWRIRNLWFSVVRPRINITLELTDKNVLWLLQMRRQFPIDWNMRQVHLRSVPVHSLSPVAHRQTIWLVIEVTNLSTLANSLFSFLEGVLLLVVAACGGEFSGSCFSSRSGLFGFIDKYYC